MRNDPTVKRNRLTALELREGDSALDDGQCVERAEAPIASSESFLSDESRLRGWADRLFLPETESELAAILRAASASNTPVTLSCGRTGITGGAVPMGGWLVSFERMRRVTGLAFDKDRNEFRLKCQPGVSLDAIAEALEKKQFPDEDAWPEKDREALSLLRSAGPYVFPPDPTERTACLGGMVACNASGARTLYYGPTRNYVSRLRMLTMDGSALDLQRGQCRASEGGEFELALPGGKRRRGRTPGYSLPRVKNAAGFFAESGMDLLDLFIGSEGTLAVFSEIEIVLVRAPETVLGVLAFFGSETDAVAFVRAARGEVVVGRETPSLPMRPMALEFFDERSLQLLRDQKRRQGAGSPIPALPDGACAAVHIEIEPADGSDAAVENAAEAMLALLEARGGAPDKAWTALTGEERRRLRDFRHALPEAVNQKIGEMAARCPGLTKLGTDFSVPGGRLTDLLDAYHAKLDAAGLEYVIFGHIGNNHLHANILPRNAVEHEKGKGIYMELARLVVEWGGSVSGEHGIGKLKKELLRLMVGDSAVEEMRSVKKVFDPRFLLNRGNVFD